MTAEAFLTYLILVVTVIGSGSVVFLFRKEQQRTVKFLLAFSGAFLIGITFMVLAPEVFGEPAALTGLFVVAGFLLQVFLELITEGVEHGHSHRHAEGERASPFLLLAGLSIHSFLEGMPIIPGQEGGIPRVLVLGIVVHNIPICITLMSLFLHYGCSRTRAFIYLIIFSLMTPFGSLFSLLLDSTMAASIDTYLNYIMAVVIGIFLHVSTSILFEAEENHRYNMQKFLTVILGLALAFGVSMIEHPH